MATRSRIQGHGRELSTQVISTGAMAGQVLGALAGRKLGDAMTRRLIGSRSAESRREPQPTEAGLGDWIMGGIFSWLITKLADPLWQKVKETAQEIGRDAEQRAQDAGSDPNPYEPTDAGVPAGTNGPPDEGAEAGGDDKGDPEEPKRDLPEYTRGDD